MSLMLPMALLAGAAGVGGRWQVAGGRWQVAGGRWQVAGGNDDSDDQDEY
jgi:hypothetical protein